VLTQARIRLAEWKEFSLTGDLLVRTVLILRSKISWKGKSSEIKPVIVHFQSRLPSFSPQFKVIFIVNDKLVFNEMINVKPVYNKK